MDFLHPELLGSKQRVSFKFSPNSFGKIVSHVNLCFFFKDNKDENFIPLESNSRLFISTNGSIEIRNAERQHEGFYNCQADNGIGASISKTIYLKVNSKFLLHLITDD